MGGTIPKQYLNLENLPVLARTLEVHQGHAAGHALGLHPGQLARHRGLGEPAVDPGAAAVFLDRGRVALSCGLDFGAGGVGHARLNLAAAPESITEAVRRMAAALG